MWANSVDTYQQIDGLMQESCNSSGLAMGVPDSKVHVANKGPTGSCRPQMGPMLAPCTLLSGVTSFLYQPGKMGKLHQRSFDYFAANDGEIPEFYNAV